MPFKRSESPRTLELTSLIDIVFLLLIFFLVSFAFSLTGDVSESKTNSDISLPKANSELPVLPDDRLDNLMIQIVPDTTNVLMAHRVFILWPAMHDSVGITRVQAYQTALEDSTFSGIGADFLKLDKQAFAALPACRLISNSIAKYFEVNKFSRRSGHSMVEVRAEENTEFKIINFIMAQCGNNEDAVPQIIIRTTP